MQRVKDGGVAKGQRVVETVASASEIIGNIVFNTRPPTKAGRPLSNVILVTSAVILGPEGLARPLLHHGEKRK